MHLGIVTLKQEMAFPDCCYKVGSTLSSKMSLYTASVPKMGLFLADVLTCCHSRKITSLTNNIYDCSIIFKCSGEPARTIPGSCS